MMNVKEMTTDALNKRVDELSKILDSTFGIEWDSAYDEYVRINNELEKRYREENKSAFDDYYTKHIKGKTFDKIDPEHWSFYSDWHKDMYGFRPRLCGGVA